MSNVITSLYTKILRNQTPFILVPDADIYITVDYYRKSY